MVPGGFDNAKGCIAKWNLQVEQIKTAFTFDLDVEQRRKMVEKVCRLFSFLESWTISSMEESLAATPETCARQFEFYSQFRRDSDPKIVAIGEEQQMLLQLRLYEKFDPQTRREALATLKKIVTTGEPDQEKVNLVRSLIATSTTWADPRVAVPVVRELMTHLSTSSDESLTKLLSDMEHTSRLLSLPGTELEFQGKTLDGQPLDLNELQGKVILVDFWAIWCGHCVAEFPKLKKYYQAYHAHGLEIVGVSLDNDREAVRKFIASKEVPWTIVHNVQDLENKYAGWTDPNVVRYGISGIGIPTVLLIGRDGKVLSICARGQILERLLNEQFPGIDVPESE